MPAARATVHGIKIRNATVRGRKRGSMLTLDEGDMPPQANARMTVALPPRGRHAQPAEDGPVRRDRGPVVGLEADLRLRLGHRRQGRAHLLPVALAIEAVEPGDLAVLPPQAQLEGGPCLRKDGDRPRLVALLEAH